MQIDEAILLTQDRLAKEGSTMRDLLVNFRDKISPVLIEEQNWQRVLECAEKHPITMGAMPFGFELPMHTEIAEADFGVSLASGTAPADYFRAQAEFDENNELAKSIMRLFEQMDIEDSPLRKIVGRKLMLEYDIGSSPNETIAFPGMFLRPGERPILGACGQKNDVCEVVDALVSSVGWKLSDSQLNSVERVYLAQPEDTRMDSFGIFPSRSRAIRLAVMGFKNQSELQKFLEEAGWPGNFSAVDSVISRFRERANIVRTGVNIDVLEDGLGPTLGLTLIVKQRYTRDSRYWLDGLTDWNPFLEALGDEEIVVPEKLEKLASWVTTPSPLFAKAGRYILMRGIHHIKLVVSEDELTSAKAYVFMVISGAVDQE